MKKFLFLSAILAGAWVAHGQTDIEALRFSQTQFTGTSRTAAMGGAMTGLGGDISSLSVNPAGLGQMGISEFTFTGGLSFTGSKTTFLGVERPEDKQAFQVNQAGVVWVPKKNFKNVKNISVGFNYQRLANFNQRFFGRGTNTTSSLTDSYAELLTFDNVDSLTAVNDPRYRFGPSLAYIGELITRFPGNEYFSTLELPLEQQVVMNRSGSMNDLSIGTGVAVNDYVMFGLSLGMPTIRYEEDYTFREADRDNVTPEFQSWEKRDILRIEGNGINAKLGFIVMPNSNIRLGAAFTTPTRYRMSDLLRTFFRSDFNSYTYDNFNSPSEGIFDYRMITPWRLSVGASGISSKFGIITVDYEVSNPGSARFDFRSNDLDLINIQNDLNDEIRAKYKATHTIRGGLESKIKEKYRVRAGVQYRTSPFANQETQDDLVKNDMLTITGGLGYRGKTFFVDATYMQMLTDELFVPYFVSFADSPVAQSNFSRGTFMLTVGVKF